MILAMSPNDAAVIGTSLLIGFATGFPLGCIAGAVGKLVWRFFFGCMVVMVCGTAMAVEPTPSDLAWREHYLNELKTIPVVCDYLEAEGFDAETQARVASAMRRQIGLKYKRLSSPAMQAVIFKRNKEKYGDSLGPSIEWLRNKGLTWEQIEDAADEAGGKDLGLKSKGGEQ